MTNFIASLNNIEALKKFVNTASNIPNFIEIHSGRHVANGKSLIGIFSLDLSNPVEVRIIGDVDPALEYELLKFEIGGR